MINFEYDKSYIIVCNQLYKDILIQDRVNYPLLNAKYYTSSEVIEIFSHTIDDDLISFIMNEFHYSYNDAKKAAHIIRFNVDGSLLNIKEKCEKNNILNKEKSIDISLFKSCKAILFEEEKNTELKYILRKNNIDFELYSIDSFFKKNNEKELDVKRFDSYYDEIDNLSRCIIKDIESGLKVNDIRVVLDIKQYEQYINMVQNLYGLKFSYKKSYSLYQCKEVQNILNYISTNKSFSLNLYEDSKEKDYISKIVSKFLLKDEEFEFSFSNLVSILKLNTITKDYGFDGGIKIINNFTIEKDKHYYVLGFNSKNYPKTFKDDSVVKDKTLVTFSVLTSFLKNEIERKKALNFINYSNINLISFSSNQLSQKYNKSSLIDELGLKIANKEKSFLFPSKLVEESYLKFNKYYTYLESNNINNLYDSNFKMLQKIDYKINKISYSSSSSYLYCPFKYYVSRILNLKEDYDDLNMRLGNFLHKILENIYEKDFDFEYNWHNYINDYATNTREKTLFNTAKEDFKFTCTSIINKFKNSKFTKYYHEKNLECNVNGFNLQGKIDSILYNDKEYIIVDYKSSKIPINQTTMEKGVNFQLPFYALLLKNDLEFKDKRILGYFINPLIIKNILFTVEEETIIERGYPLLYGYYMEQGNVLYSLDNSNYDTEKKVSDFYQSLKIAEDGLEPHKSSYLDNPSYLEELVMTHIKKYKEGVENLIFYKNNDTKTCENCGFKNICFNSVAIKDDFEEEKEEKNYEMD